MDQSTESLEQPFCWDAHPARERTGRAVLGGVVILAFAGLAGALMQSLWWGVFATFLLLVSLNRFFFPSRFTIDGAGITARCPLRRQRLGWDELRRFAVDEHGGYLSTRGRRSWIDAYRGMHIYFGRQRDAVVQRIRSRLPEGGGQWAH